MYQQKITIGDRVAAFVADKFRTQSKSEKRESARRRAAFIASQTFPNDRFERQPRRADKAAEPNTPEVNRKLLAMAYSSGPEPIIMQRRPSRREAIIKRRITEGRMRRPLKAHPLGQREGVGKDAIFTEAVRRLGHTFRVPVKHLAA